MTGTHSSVGVAVVEGVASVVVMRRGAVTSSAHVNFETPAQLESGLAEVLPHVATRHRFRRLAGGVLLAPPYVRVRPVPALRDIESVEMLGRIVSADPLRFFVPAIREVEFLGAAISPDAPPVVAICDTLVAQAVRRGIERGGVNLAWVGTEHMPDTSPDPGPDEALDLIAQRAAGPRPPRAIASSVQTRGGGRSLGRRRLAHAVGAIGLPLLAFGPGLFALNAARAAERELLRIDRASTLALQVADEGERLGAALREFEEYRATEHRASPAIATLAEVMPAGGALTEFRFSPERVVATALTANPSALIEALEGASQILHLEILGSRIAEHIPSAGLHEVTFSFMPESVMPRKETDESQGGGKA